MFKFVKNENKNYFYWGLTAFVVVAASILFFLLLSNLPGVWATLKDILYVLRPILFGFIIAYLMTPLLNFYEKKFLDKFSKRFGKTETAHNKAKRVMSTLLTMISLLLILAGVLWLIIPRTIESLTKLINEDFPNYLRVIREWLGQIFDGNKDMQETLLESFSSIGSILSGWVKSLEQVGDVLATVSSGVVSAVKLIFNFFVGVVVSVYFLYNKELFAAQSKKIIYSLFKRDHAADIVENVREVHGMFIRFISGKLVDSAIIGVLCYIVLAIFRMPYKELISIIIAVTNIIPFIGPIIGAVPCGIILLLNDPIDCLWFLVIIIVLQQVDGNILGPKILGEATGLPSFWIIFAILVSGGMFGLLGMICGVPIFAIIYEEIRRAVNRKLKKRHLSQETRDYYDLDTLIKKPEEKGKTEESGEK